METVLSQGQEATNQILLGNLAALEFHYGKIHSADGYSEVLLGSGPWVVTHGSLPPGVSWMVDGIPDFLAILLSDSDESPFHSQVFFRAIIFSSEDGVGICHMGAIHRQGNRF